MTIDTFLHVDALAPRIPEGVEIRSITPTSATIQFTLTDPFDVTRPEGFVVIYGLIAGQLNSNSSVITATSSSQTYSIPLTSLKIGTQYFYRVIATNKFATRMTAEMMFLTEDTSKSICSTITSRRLCALLVTLCCSANLQIPRAVLTSIHVETIELHN